MSWEEVECAGACVNAPMVTIGFDTYEDLTPERFEEILVAFQEGKGNTITPGPQNGRRYSAPLAGQVTLLEDVKASKPKAPTKTASEVQEPDATAPGRKRKITTEAAPAISSPAPAAAKVSVAESEAEKKKVAGPARRKPDQAMREGATGAESPAIEKTATAKKTAAPKPLFKAPKGKPDDLKLISGVGPALEAKLHALGITKYAQVASFSAEDIAKVDDSLSFKGRVERDNWVGQAKALADGGEAEYIRVFGKKPR